MVLKGITAIFFGFIIFFQSSCTNNTFEKAPDSISIEGETLQERLEYKIKSDKRLDDIINSADQLKRVYKIYLQLLKSQDNSYTPMDFIIDLSRQLKMIIPNNQAGQLIRRGQIKVPIENLSLECQIIETQLESFDYNNDEIVDSIIYSFKGCGTKDQFLSIIQADWTYNNKMELKFIDQGLKIIFFDGLLTDLNENAVCQFESFESYILNTISCNQLKIVAGKTSILFHHLLYNNYSSIRLQTEGEIYNKEKIDSWFSIIVPEKGLPEIIFESR